MQPYAHLRAFPPLNSSSYPRSNHAVELARGSLSEQPWGLTLGALARRSATGELTLTEGAMRIVLAFEAGRLVAATSTMRAASLLERAARTFELTRGSYTITDAVTLRPERGAAVELRAVVFAGARKYLPDDRLGMELRELGSRYMLASAPADELARFGLESATPILEGLREGATLAELEARYHEVDGRELRAAVYALVCCGAARGLLPARAPSSPGTGRAPTPQGSRTTTPGSRTITPGSRTITPASSRAPTPSIDRTPTRPDKPSAHIPDPSRTITPDTATRSEATPTPLARIPTMNIARSKTPPDEARTKTPPDSPHARTTELGRVKTTDVARVKTSDVARVKTSDVVPVPPPTLDAPTVRDARSVTLRPEPLDAATERDRAPSKPTGPPSSGRTPTRVTPAGGVPLVGATTSAARADADAAADRARAHLAAGEHEPAVREAASAMHLAPDSFDHQALHAWAVFLAARDRHAAADVARKVLE
jgi:hypothetical protein